jgi:hypothetical protein
MAERSKRVLIDIPRISNQRVDEIAARLRKLIRSRLREARLQLAGRCRVQARAGLNLRSS